MKFDKFTGVCMTGGIRHTPSHTNVCKFLIFQLTFCTAYDYAGKADLSKG